MSERNVPPGATKANLYSATTSGAPDGLQQPKRAKYGNRRVSLDGYAFDSRAEGERYIVLREKQRLGEIDELLVHPTFALTVNGVKVCTYEADFSYLADSEVVEDVKSPITRKNRDYRIKVKLMFAVHGIRVTEVVP